MKFKVAFPIVKKNGIWVLACCILAISDYYRTPVFSVSGQSCLQTYLPLYTACTMKNHADAAIGLKSNGVYDTTLYRRYETFFP
jgi:hypothetical protein